MTEPQDKPAESFEQYRAYLALLAREQMNDRLQMKIEPSDVVQQTHAEAFEHQGQFRGKSETEKVGWLRQILANNLADIHRRFGAAKRDVGREHSLDAALEKSSAKLGNWLANSTSSPSQKAMRHEDALRLAQALEQLPDAQREAVMLRHLHGDSLNQIATTLNRSPSATAGLLKRGLKQLRQILDRMS